MATIYVARMLGPEAYGQLGYAMSFVAFFGFLVTLGIDAILYRDLIQKPAERERLVGTAFFIRIFSAVLTTAIVTSISLIISPGIPALLIFILSSSLILNATQVVFFDFQARAESKYPALLIIGISIVINILKVLVVFAGLGVIFIAGTFFIESILYGIGCLYLFHVTHKISPLTWRVDIPYAIHLLRRGFPFLLFTAFSAGTIKIGHIMINNFLGPEFVGLYDAAARLVDFLVFIPTLLITALLPAVISVKNTSEEGYVRRFSFLTFFVVATSLILASVLFFGAPFFISLLYGAAYTASIPILKIYAWALVGISISTLAAQYLIAEDAYITLAFISFPSFILSCVLLAILIPIQGIFGAAYVTVFCSWITPVLLVIFFQFKKSSPLHDLR